MRCPRCGHESGKADKFCSDCGNFLRDAFIDHRLLLALVHEREGRTREARRELERLLEVDPDHALANHLLGTFYFHQGTLDLAIERYRKALGHAPQFVLAAYDLGVAWYHRGNMKEAVRAFRHCLELDPHYNAAHYRLALALFHAGDLEGAIEHCEKTVTLTPEYMMAHYHMGVIHERRDELDAAAAAFRRSIDEGIGETSSVHHLSRILQGRGDEARARRLMERAGLSGKG